MRSEEISDLVGEVVAGEGAELIELQCVGSSRRPLLRAFVDIPGGTTVGACAELSRKIEARLEASDLLGPRYVLEVSSPGLDRPLRSRRDFERLTGRPIRIRLREDSAEEIVGRVEEVGGPPDADFWVVVTADGSAPRRVRAEEIAFARAHVPF